MHPGCASDPCSNAFDQAPHPLCRMSNAHLCPTKAAPDLGSCGQSMPYLSIRPRPAQLTPKANTMEHLCKGRCWIFLGTTINGIQQEMRLPLLDGVPGLSHPNQTTSKALRDLQRCNRPPCQVQGCAPVGDSQATRDRCLGRRCSLAKLKRIVQACTCAFVCANVCRFCVCVLRACVHVYVAGGLGQFTTKTIALLL